MIADERTARHELAQATAKRIFDNSIFTDAKEHEPESAAELRKIWVSHAFGDSWTRTALDDRTRSIITVAILAALGAEAELKLHIDGALSLGVTPDELVDIFAHVGVYAGIPRAGSGWDVVTRVLQRRAERATGAS